MKLITNENNVDALKIVIAANEVKQSVEIELGGDLVPCLVDESSDLKLFVVNSACLFLHENALVAKIKKSPDEVQALCQDILNWEATVLRPILSTYHTTKKNLEELKSALKKQVLPILEGSGNQRLGNYPNFKDIVPVWEIVIWCDLYPILQENSGVFDSLPAIKKWMESLQGKESFKKGLSTIFKNIQGNKKIKWNFATWNKKAGGGAAAVETNVKNATKCCENATTTVDVSSEELAAAKKAWNTPLKKSGKQVKKGEKVLPKKGERNVLITSALPYVNNVPHLGNIVGAVLSADVFARFCRLRGYNTLYICGTDEYGTQTETKALKEGLTPKQICDKYNKLHDEIYQWFDIGFDHFGRTTTEKQTQIAQDIFWQLDKAGNLLEDAVDQWFCEKCDTFLADRFVEGICPLPGCGYDDARGDQCDKCGKLINAVELKNPRCCYKSNCDSIPKIRTSKHIFIDLPKVEDELNSWLEKSSQSWSNNARVIAKSWLKGGLQPRCITRDLKWGTPVPKEGYESKVFYVWFDAPIGYISITANYTDEWKKWWQNPEEVDYYQFMAKDNVPFHSVVFPSTQLGTASKWTMVNHLMSTEYLNYEDAKFSKSRGIGVFGNDAQDTGIPADIWRFYLMYTRPENADSAFKWEDLMLKTNSELLANLGNFVNRALKFTKDNFNGTVGKVTLTKEDETILVQINRCLKQYVDLLEKCKEREAISQILNISRIGNQLMQAEQPWKLMKSKNDQEKARAYSVVSLCANISCLLAVLVEPFMPNLSSVLLKQLDAKLEDVNILAENKEEDRLFRCFLPEGHKIGQPGPLIKEIKADEINALKQKFAGNQESREKSKSASPPKTVVKGDTKVVDEAKVKELEGQVTEQGDAVRKLKESKAAKDEISAAVEKLLSLKKELALAKGEDPNQAAGGNKKKGKKK